MPREDWPDQGDYRRSRHSSGDSQRSEHGGFGRAPLSPSRENERFRRSDRELWAIIADSLEADRNLDLREVQMIVQAGEVTLNGRVDFKTQKRRIEDLADIPGVTHVQNNLRVTHHSHWTFF